MFLIIGAESTDLNEEWFGIRVESDYVRVWLVR